MIFFFLDLAFIRSPEKSEGRDSQGQRQKQNKTQKQEGKQRSEGTAAASHEQHIKGDVCLQEGSGK